MPFHFFTILGITILQCSIAHEIQLPFNSAFRLTYASKAHAANSEGATNFSQGATCFLHAHVLLVSLFYLLEGVSYCVPVFNHVLWEIEERTKGFFFLLKRRLTTRSVYFITYLLEDANVIWSVRTISKSANSIWDTLFCELPQMCKLKTYLNISRY